MEILITIIYSISLLYIFLFSLGQLHLAWIYIRNKKSQPDSTQPLTVFPLVTVQLPVYNEKYVVERLLDAVSKFNYPKDRLDIQILDDSTDETTEIISKKMEELTPLQLDIKLLHRYKSCRI